MPSSAHTPHPGCLCPGCERRRVIERIRRHAEALKAGRKELTSTDRLEVQPSDHGLKEPTI